MAYIFKLYWIDHHLFHYCIFYFSVLVMEPFGEMSLASCKVKLLQDWYTFFQVCVFSISRIKEIFDPNIILLCS